MILQPCCICPLWTCWSYKDTPFQPHAKYCHPNDPNHFIKFWENTKCLVFSKVFCVFLKADKHDFGHCLNRVTIDNIIVSNVYFLCHAIHLCDMQRKKMWKQQKKKTKKKINFMNSVFSPLFEASFGRREDEGREDVLRGRTKHQAKLVTLFRKVSELFDTSQRVNFQDFLLKTWISLAAGGSGEGVSKRTLKYFQKMTLDKWILQNYRLRW